MNLSYLFKKIVFILVVLYIIATLNFIIFQATPKNPVDIIFNPRLPPEYRERLKTLWGIDKPLFPDRYLIYLRNMFTLNFGYSFNTKTPVIGEIEARLPKSLLLLGSAFIISVLIGVPLGVFAASKRGKKVDVLAIGFGLFTWAAPIFFVQLFFLLLFAYYFRFFPVGQFTDVPPPTGPFAYMVNVLYHMALPLITLVLVDFGSWALYTRNMMLDTLTQDYIVTAQAKGLEERTVLFHHGLRAILPPVTTMILLAIPSLMTGSVITEYIFAWPGIGQWLIKSILALDYPAVQALFFIFAILTVGANFLADLLYGWLDPRIRVGVRR
jgi:peptide/nickel transport system permease protein